MKQDNLSANNAEISKILSKMWKEAPGDVRAAYLKEEERQRQKYAAGMQEWREKRALEAEQEKEELNSREETEREHKKIGKGAISQDGKPQLGATTISNNGAASHLLGLGRQGKILFVLCYNTFFMYSNTNVRLWC